MEKRKYYRLQELDRSNFEIVKGDPDVRGWDVRYMTGEKLGTVDELIIDADEKRVRYMVVDLDENELKLKEREILIPIGLAELDKKEDDVLIPNITIEQLSRLPDYDKDNLNPLVERRIAVTLGREMNDAELAHRQESFTRNESMDRKLKQDEKKNINEIEEHDPDFYSHEHYNTDNFYRNRRQRVTTPENESDYYQGLRLWEKRSEGGLLDETDLRSSEKNDLGESTRSARRKARRDNYRQRRYNESI